MFLKIRAKEGSPNPVFLVQAIRNTSSAIVPSVIREIEIWRVAVLMINRYADEAEANSFRRAEELAAEGDHAGAATVIYTTPVSRADGADVVMLPTDLSAETGVPPLTNAVEDTAEAGFPDEITPQVEDYIFLKRRPSAFYGTGVAELLHMLRRDTIIIGGGATNRGVETSVREAFNLDLASVVVRECCWSSDTAAHVYSLDKAMKMYARIRNLDQVTAMLRE
jgi:maleamate amidohydrolase